MKFSVLRGWDVTQFLALKRKWAERNSDALQREDSPLEKWNRVYTAESQGERSGAVYRTFAPRGG